MLINEAGADPFHTPRARIGCSIGFVGLVLVGGSVIAFLLKLVQWLRFGIPVHFDDTVITLLASLGFDWAKYPHDWLQIHLWLSKLSVAAAAFFAGFGLFMWGLSIGDKAYHKPRRAA